MFKFCKNPLCSVLFVLGVSLCGVSSGAFFSPSLHAQQVGQVPNGQVPSGQIQSGQGSQAPAAADKPVANSSEMPSQSAPSVPELTRFDDWEMACVSQNEAGAKASSATVPPKSSKRCQLSHRLAVKETGQNVFLMTVLPAAKAGQYAGIISVPLGGYLAPGMHMSIDGSRGYKILFETCNAMGCHAGFEMAGRLLSEISRGQKARIKLWTGKNTPVDVEVSLKGFGKAWAALKEETKS